MGILANWPAVQILADFTKGPPNAPGVNAVDINVGSVAVTDVSIKRGRQYELDKVQTGTAKLTISDPDEQLNPGNAASPYNIGANKIKPYRPMQVKATWNGITYNVFTGYIERYPLQWEDAGTRGIRPLDAVDALSVLSRSIVSQSYAMEIAKDAPTVYMPLSDAAPPGMVEPITIQNGVYTVSGGSVQWGGDTLPDGSKAVNLSQQKQDLATVPEQFTSIDSRRPNSPAIMSLDPAGSVIEFWAKLSGGSGQIVFQQVIDTDFNNPSIAGDIFFGLVPYGAGPHFLNFWDQPELNNLGLGPYYDAVSLPYAWTGFPDGQWHYFAIRFIPDAGGGYTVAGTIDNLESQWTGIHGRIRRIGINSIHMHATTEYGDDASKLSVARVAYYNRDITGARTQAHYWRGIGNYGEFASDRAVRLLGKYWGGPNNVFMDHATRLDGDHGYDGRSVLDVLQEITQTTFGLVYADKNGRIVVENRYARYVALDGSGNITGPNPSIATLGELESPYIDIQYDYDPTYVYSQSILSRPGGPAPITRINAQAQADYGQRVLSATLNVTNDFDLNQAGVYLESRYSNPRLRIEKVTIDPSSNPSLWPLALGLEISQRLTVKRRTASGAVLSADYYVESIDHEIKSEPRAWTVSIQLSPVFVSAVWILGNSTSGILGQTTVPVY